MSTDTLDLIFKQAQQLPPESLADLAKYVEFLRFKVGRKETTQQEPRNLRIVKLRGLLKGYDVSPESLAAARREMWHKLESVQP